MENNYNLEDKDIQYLEILKDAFTRGFYVKGGEVTELYNKVFNKKLTPTNCQTCIKLRVKELLKFYEQYKQSINNEVKEEIIEEQHELEVKPKVGRGRPKKNS